MKLYKILLILCLLLLVTDSLCRRLASWRKKVQDENAIDVTEELDEQNEEEAKALVLKKGSKGKKSNNNDNDDDDDDQGDDEDDDDDDGDEGSIIACGPRKNEKHCICETKVLLCDKVTIDNELLDSANIDIFLEEFIPETVKITNNGIKKLLKDKIMPDLEPHVKVLDFSNNLISKIENGAFDAFDTLTVLKLGSNKLAKGITSKVLTANLGKNLHQLFLDNNEIRKLPDDVFKNMKALTTLVLDNNKKIVLTDELFSSSLAKLEKLSLDGCEISDLNDQIFSQLVNLKQLSLRDNPMQVIPKAINAIPKLIGLDLSETALNEIDTDKISADHALEMISLQKMPYLYIIRDCAFCGLPNLKNITTEGSKQLYEINENAFGNVNKTGKSPVAKIQNLNLRNCNFSTLHENLLDWDAVKSLEIGGNPFSCDCKLSWLINDQDKHTYDIVPKCASPEPFKDVPFTQANGSVCQSSSRFIMWGFVFFLTSLALIGGFLVYTRRVRVTNFMYRPEVPQMGYSNLTAQQHRDDEEELQGDFQPKPEASV